MLVSMESGNETGVSDIPGLCPALVELSLTDEEGASLREEELFEEVTAVEESCFSRSVLSENTCGISTSRLRCVGGYTWSTYFHRTFFPMPVLDGKGSGRLDTSCGRSGGSWASEWEVYERLRGGNQGLCGS